MDNAGKDRTKEKKNFVILFVVFVTLLLVVFLMNLIKYADGPKNVVKKPPALFTLGVAGFKDGLSVGSVQATVEEKQGPISSSRYIDEGAPYIGNPLAPLKIVEFGDFQCPFSKQAFSMIREFALQNPDQVFFQYRDYPLESIHPYAFEYALAGKCAAAQNKFWQEQAIKFLFSLN